MTETDEMTGPTPAMYQSVVQMIQCRLLMLRISELYRHEDDEVVKRAIMYLQQVVSRLSDSAKQQRQAQAQLMYKKSAFSIANTIDEKHGCIAAPSLITLNAMIRRVKAHIVLTLMHIVRSHGGESRVERRIVSERVNAFVGNRAAACEPEFRCAMRFELAHLHNTFDRAIVNVYGHQRPAHLLCVPSFVRAAFLAQALPRFIIGNPVPGDMTLCPICYDPFTCGAVAARFTVCQHPFHAACVDK